MTDHDDTLKAVAGEELCDRREAERTYGRMSDAWMSANGRLIAKLAEALEEAKAERNKYAQSLSTTRIWCSVHLGDQENDALERFVATETAARDRKEGEP